jgi:hypothetical protein
MVANFWRATLRDPDAVASFADWPVNEADLHARHKWLVLSPEAAEFRAKMRSDPDHFDAKIAGWWCWGLCCWIGGGWCTAHGSTIDGNRKQIMPSLHPEGGKGVNRKPEHDWQQRPCLHEGSGVTHTAAHKKRPGLGDGNGGAGHKGVNSKMPGMIGGTDARGINCQVREGRPQLANEFSLGRGVNANLPDKRPMLTGDFSYGKGVNSNDALGTCARRREWLLDWFGRLRDRLRQVRVCCGDWIRVCGSHSVTTRLGLTGIFLDPPYGDEADRDMNLYAVDCGKVASRVRAYCLERGVDPQMRIALCGYEGEHDELEKHGWAVVAWKAQGGYGNRSDKGRKNKERERIWFSPYCLKDEKERGGLFGGLN